MLNGDKPEGSDVEWMDALELGDKILANYRAEYGLDEQWEILSPEQTAQVVIRHPVTKEPVCIYVATFDIVARNLETGRIWLWDHKTAASIQTDHLWGDDQAGSYFAIAKSVLVPKGMMKPTETLKGILYNFIMKSPPDERPENADGLKTNAPTKKHYADALVHEYGSDGDQDEELTDPKYWMKKDIPALQDTAKLLGVTVLGDVSAKQPAKRFLRHPVPRTRHEQKKQIERIGSEAVVMGMYRSGELPIIKNPTKDCRFCDFRDVCEIDEKGGDTDEYIDAVFKQEDPYEAHRLREKPEE